MNTIATTVVFVPLKQALIYIHISHQSNQSNSWFLWFFVLCTHLFAQIKKLICPSISHLQQHEKEKKTNIKRLWQNNILLLRYLPFLANLGWKKKTMQKTVFKYYAIYKKKGGGETRNEFLCQRLNLASKKTEQQNYTFFLYHFLL